MPNRGKYRTMNIEVQIPFFKEQVNMGLFYQVEFDLSHLLLRVRFQSSSPSHLEGKEGTDKCRN